MTFKTVEELKTWARKELKRAIDEGNWLYAMELEQTLKSKIILHEDGSWEETGID